MNPGLLASFARDCIRFHWLLLSWRTLLETVDLKLNIVAYGLMYNMMFMVDILIFGTVVAILEY